ncbi:hypothetical protein Avbf_11858 [Armadillidium vulgare]|nr:hypothetical protein Avbf_11858 [Armadillidium vulgare]
MVNFKAALDSQYGMTTVFTDIYQFCGSLFTGSLMNENDHYIWYHHSSGDRIDVYNSPLLDEVAALWTAVSYVAADVTFHLPQGNISNKFKKR